MYKIRNCMVTGHVRLVGALTRGSEPKSDAGFDNRTERVIKEEVVKGTAIVDSVI